MNNLYYYKIAEDVLDPKYGTASAACFDIHAYIKSGKRLPIWSDSSRKETFRTVSDERITLYANERMLIPTGLIFNIPEGYSVRLYARSGLSFKKGLVLANSVGIIDSDYVEETQCIIHNCSENNIIINNGDRICQAEMVAVEQLELLHQDQRPESKTDRSGGFGSTGI